MKSFQTLWIRNFGDLCLALIIIAGIYMRLSNLWVQGFIYGDGAVHWKAVVEAMNQGVYHWYHAKPGHMFLLWVYAKIFGIKSFVPMAVSFSTGLLCVGTVYLIGRLIFSPRAGLFSTALISISPWHIYYSRTTGSTGNAIFFWTLALFLYLLSRPEWSKNQEFHAFQCNRQNKKALMFLVLSGFSMGFAFSCHYNLGILPFIFFVFELSLIAKIWMNSRKLTEKNSLTNQKPFLWGETLPNNALRIFVLFSAMLYPLVIFNFTHIYLTYEKIFNIPYDPLKNEVVFSYFHQIIIQLISSTTAIWGSISDFSFWISAIWNNEGAPMFIILILGLLFGIRKITNNFEFNHIATILPFLIIFTFLINSKYTAQARSFALSIPLIALITGNFLAEFLKNYKINAWLWCIPLIIFAYNFPLLLSQSQISNRELEIKQYLTQHKITAITVQEKPMFALAYKTVDKLLYSPNQEWTKKKIRSTRKLKLNINPPLLLARFTKEELTSQYKCFPLAQWPKLTGRSIMDFEGAKTNRNWNLSVREDPNWIIGVFLMNRCFIENN